MCPGASPAFRPGYARSAAVAYHRSGRQSVCVARPTAGRAENLRLRRDNDTCKGWRLGYDARKAPFVGGWSENQAPFPTGSLVEAGSGPGKPGNPHHPWRGACQRKEIENVPVDAWDLTMSVSARDVADVMRCGAPHAQHRLGTHCRRWVEGLYRRFYQIACSGLLAVRHNSERGAPGPIRTPRAISTNRRGYGDDLKARLARVRTPFPSADCPAPTKSPR